MIKLSCAIVGVPGSVFSVRVDEADLVDGLKKAIKARKVYQFPADELQLILAKTTDGKWLPPRSGDVTKLKEGQTTATMNRKRRKIKNYRKRIHLRSC
ncbi:unnamed protein product [Peronospora belbahrii]|uniref:Crinkler effector protein N-terminal domain-containing protein n=1 Tax=Peronospora belbahrii TaxID=622444 RepID=A0AAU9L050_9STRA|nr:unnamed protein product [Peronospora belbahrii]CAH0515978.1 unnamed protein product [Peronospora belbahrii]